MAANRTRIFADGVRDWTKLGVGQTGLEGTSLTTHTCQVGSHDTTLKRGELGPGLLRKMLDQLRIRKEDF